MKRIARILSSSSIMLSLLSCSESEKSDTTATKTVTEDGLEEKWESTESGGTRGGTRGDESGKGESSTAGTATADSGSAPPPGSSAGLSGGSSTSTLFSSRGDSTPDASKKPEEPPSSKKPEIQQSSLEGGEIDDNERFGAYIEYVTQFLKTRDVKNKMIHWVDVSERYIVQVQDGQGRPVSGATIQILSNGEKVLEGRTFSGGLFPVFPEALDIDSQTRSIDVRILQGQSTSDYRIVRGSDTLHVIQDPSLYGVSAATTPLDVLFVIDSTGSMSEEIEQIKTTVTSIARQIGALQTASDLRFGLVEYRDRGDAFVTHSVEFTPNVQAFSKALAPLFAGGGGDMPEALNKALHVSLNEMEWRGNDALKIMFIIADAPPHYYQDESYTYDVALYDALKGGIKIYPIASGGSDDTAEFVFRQLAQSTLSRFVFITEGGGSSSGSSGSDYHVDPQDFSVKKLDSIVVRIVSEELDTWSGAKTPKVIARMERAGR